MDLAWRWRVPNLRYSIWNTLEPTAQRFDMVCSTEMLEHIEDDETAAKHMKMAAEKYIYCLVPFSDKATNANEQKRQRAWDRHEHFVCGYDDERLQELFGEAIHIRGTYTPTGAALRARLHEMQPDDIRAAQAELEVAAEEDLTTVLPKTLDDAAGIKILARAS